MEGPLLLHSCVYPPPRLLGFDVHPTVSSSSLRVLLQANYLSNADDLFKFLYDKGIGGTHAHFWIVWAMYAEKVGKFPLAER